MDIQITHIKFSGDEQGAQTLLKSLGDIFMRGGNAPSLPVAEPMEALPAPASEPVVVAPIATRRISVAKPTSKGQKLALQCQEKPGNTYTVNEAAEVSGVQPQSIHAALGYAKQKGVEWATAGTFHFKRVAPAAA